MPRVSSRLAFHKNFLFSTTAIYITEQKLNELMAEFHQSKCDVDEQLAESKRKVTMAQDKTFLDLARKISNLLYQFKKKSYKL